MTWIYLVDHSGVGPIIQVYVQADLAQALRVVERIAQPGQCFVVQGAYATLVEATEWRTRSPLSEFEGDPAIRIVRRADLAQFGGGNGACGNFKEETHE